MGSGFWDVEVGSGTFSRKIGRHLHTQTCIHIYFASVPFNGSDQTFLLLWKFQKGSSDFCFCSNTLYTFLEYPTSPKITSLPLDEPCMSHAKSIYLYLYFVHHILFFLSITRCSIFTLHLVGSRPSHVFSVCLHLPMKEFPTKTLLCSWYLIKKKL